MGASRLSPQLPRRRALGCWDCCLGGRGEDRFDPDGQLFRSACHTTETLGIRSHQHYTLYGELNLGVKMRLLASVIFVSTAGPLAAQEMLPGQWETTVAVKSIEGAMIPPQMKEIMRKRGPTVVKSCMTAAQIKKGPQDIAGKSNGACKAKSFSVSGGKMNSSMVCTMPQGTSTTSATGTYSAKQYKSRSQTVVVTRGQKMTTTAEVTGRWLGPCLK
jgi:Protein of unknown function (DUF3617)